MILVLELSLLLYLGYKLYKSFENTKRIMLDEEEQKHG